MLSVAVVVRCAQASRYPASDRGLSLRDGAEACHKLVIIETVARRLPALAGRGIATKS